MLVVLGPPVIFEKYTYHLYLVGNPAFFNYSGSRLWFDIVWFCAGGMASAFIVGRDRKESILPPLIGSLLFVISVYVHPFCAVRECYVSSTDGLAPLRDFLLLGSLGLITSTSALKQWHDPNLKKWIDSSFQLGFATFVGFALSFFPVSHIFAGVSAPYPLNYVHWILAGVPAGLAGSMLIVGRSSLSSVSSKISAGSSGVVLAIILSVILPCSDCSGYPVAVASIVSLALLFTIPSILIGRKIADLSRKSVPVRRFYRRAPVAIATTAIVVSIILLLSFYYVWNYEASVVNGFAGVSNSVFSPLEVGRTFVYSAGYLSIPRVTSSAVGVNVSFSNTTMDSTNNFLAAGVGDQSPNCCKDGLDLAYRIDAIEFSNGTQAVLARAWWACDTNMACGGYSWQKLLHFGSQNLPKDALSNWVGLEMKWASGIVQWFYMVSYANGSTTSWTLFSSFVPPSIQNHYWDAGLFYVGAGNLPSGYAYFYQFGVSSAYPFGGWHVLMECPEIYLNNHWSCISSAAFISGSHSFWKVIYTFGENYPRTTFAYLGNHEVEFFSTSSEKSPADGTPMW